jgi:hypothetical protein
VITTEEILIDSSPHVMESREAVRRRRSLIENPGFCPLAKLHGALENVVRLPSGEFDLFNGHKFEVGADGAKHGSPSMNPHIVVNEVILAIRRLLCFRA